MSLESPNPVQSQIERQMRTTRERWQDTGVCPRQIAPASWATEVLSMTLDEMDASQITRTNLPQAVEATLQTCTTQLERSEGVFLATRRFGQLGASQLRETLALPPGNLANQITTVQIPAGTRLFIGRVRPQVFETGPLPGGGNFASPFDDIRKLS